MEKPPLLRHANTTNEINSNNMRVNTFDTTKTTRATTTEEEEGQR
jgi:hypothetical protein